MRALRWAATLAILFVIACDAQAPATDQLGVTTRTGAPTVVRSTASAAPATSAPATPAPETAAPTAAPRTPTPPTPAPPTLVPKAAAFVRFISATSPVAKGGTATVKIATSPNATCAITVTYGTAGPARAAGLEPRAADDFGSLTWSWTVATGTAPGTYPIDVVCGELGTRVTFNVQ